MNGALSVIELWGFGLWRTLTFQKNMNKDFLLGDKIQVKWLLIHSLQGTAMCCLVKVVKTAKASRRSPRWTYLYLFWLACPVHAAGALSNLLAPAPQTARVLHCAGAHAVHNSMSVHFKAVVVCFISLSSSPPARPLSSEKFLRWYISTFTTKWNRMWRTTATRGGNHAGLEVWVVVRRGLNPSEKTSSKQNVLKEEERSCRLVVCGGSENWIQPDFHEWIW